MTRKRPTPKKMITSPAGSSTSSPNVLYHSPMPHDSDPELDVGTGDVDSDNCANVNRNKRKACGTPPRFDNITFTGNNMDEMRKLFSDLTTTQDLRFKELRNSMKEDNEEIRKSIRFLSDKYDNVLTEVKTIQIEKKAEEKRIAALEDKVEFLEKKTCSTLIEIRNVPCFTPEQNKHESKEHLSSIVKEIGRAVNTDIQDLDIKDIYRLKSPDNIKTTIIVELSTVPKKDKFLAAIKHFNKGKKVDQKLHTGHLNIPFSCDRQPIYISESLTKKASKLFFEVRKFAKNNGMGPCWTSRGAIFLRIDENKHIMIQSEQDLEKIKLPE
ncbi:hypothetical protein NE865_13463 [Phthorimaea operculella]|nr:hypothetical protein NE865_13463 [Phthorimaea operculella]